MSKGNGLTSGVSALLIIDPNSRGICHIFIRLKILSHCRQVRTEATTAKVGLSLNPTRADCRRISLLLQSLLRCPEWHEVWTEIAVYTAASQGHPKKQLKNKVVVLPY